MFWGGGNQLFVRICNVVDTAKSPLREILTGLLCHYSLIMPYEIFYLCP